MTSTLPPNANPNTAQSASGAPSAPSGTPSVRSSYANATKGKPIGAPIVASSTPPAIVGGPAQHGKASSASPVNGKSAPPAIPSGAPPIVSSGSIANGGQEIKPSPVTISAQGTTGYLPNGGSAGQASRPNIHFGSMNPSGSPAVAPSVPHIPQNSNLGAPMSNSASSQRSPSPIPQPALSGGRPPSAPQGQGSQLNFGNLGGSDNPDQNLRSSAQLPTGPANLVQSQHLRTQSSQSQHSDMSGHMNRNNMQGNGRGRGGYAPQYPASNLAHSSPQMYRQSPAMAPRNPNVPSFTPQNSMRGPPASPYQQNRSPAITPASIHGQPHIANGQPVPHAYGQYPQHLAPQVNNPISSRNTSSQSGVASFGRRGGGNFNSMPMSSPVEPPVSYLSTDVFQMSQDEISARFANVFSAPGNIEEYLTFVKSAGMYGVPPQDYYGAYYGASPYMQQNMMQYQNAPASPRFNPATHGPPHPGYMPGPYNAPPNMSRTPSQQGSDRAASTVQQVPTPLPPTQPPPVVSSSPAPPSQPRKSKAIVIKNADGEIVDLKNLSSQSPAPAQSGPPPVVSSGPGVPTTPAAPPPRKEPEPAPQHTRTDSQPSKSSEETKRLFAEQFKRQLQLDEEEKTRAAKEKEAAAAKEVKVEPVKTEPEVAKTEEPKIEAKATEPAADDKDAAERKRVEDEEAWIRELEEQEREEEERERAYQEKKKKQKEEEARKEAEAALKEDEELKRQEREAEEREAAKISGKTEPETDKAKAEDAKLFASLKRPTLGPGAEGSEVSTPASESMPPPPVPTPAASTPTPVAKFQPAKPKPSMLKIETTKVVEPAQPTAGMQSLRSARFLKIQAEDGIYPEGIRSPNPALNQGGKSRGRQYDKDFLLQFQEVFKEKPSVNWDKTLKETVGDGDSGSARPQSARTPSMGGRQNSRNAGPVNVMGSFAAGASAARGTTSEQRFAASNGPSRVSGSFANNPLAQFSGAGRGMGFPMGSQAMSRQGSAQSRGPQMNSPRSGSGRNSSRRDKNPHQEAVAAKNMPLTAGKDLKPLELSKTGWKPASLVGASQPALPGTHLAPDLVQRKVKASLNKMTPEKFDKISGDILQIAAQSKDESDGRTLRQVIQLTFEKACDEAHWASMYAKFCKRMLETMSTEIKDENVKDKNGLPVVGGALFRKYLLNRCQEEFERGWELNLPAAPEGGASQEAVMLSDEYYVAAAAKRRGLGLIHFIGELYKLGMLTIRIMHECVVKLLNFTGLPEESTVESLVKLLRTIGSTMDAVVPNGREMINMYFDRIDNVMKQEALPSRLYYMLLDTVELRRKNWDANDADKGPKTITEIHEEAARKAQAADIERQKNARFGNRPGAGRGDNRSFSNNMGAPPPDYPRNQVGMDDLKKLAGRARPNAGGSGSLGPSSMFSASRSGSRRGLGPPRADDSAPSSRTGTPPVKEKEPTASVNSFSILADTGDADNEVTSPPSTSVSPALAKSTPAKSGDDKTT
ncbi:hypothetical protein BT63DRAFT_114385 [Microthyrium microscopicum]|uniref:MIF4G domain-containing protein n=1 Tax=Microthyrium microscopicum TaxID=703497 RepID=A0A6A6TX36_9PEZI|nr:hypothetical protein BT63DRAFT_114385 [Microthyrium microscopicum]